MNPSPALPAVQVSWQDATAFAAWLSDRTGKLYRLPTDEEWAYAAGSRFQDDGLALENNPRDPSKRWLAQYDREAETRGFVRQAASGSMSGVYSISPEMFGNGRIPASCTSHLIKTIMGRLGRSSIVGCAWSRASTALMSPTSSVMREQAAVRSALPQAISVSAWFVSGGKTLAVALECRGPLKHHP